ncbi:MAG: hypothetical protein P5702_21000 [Limnospira sp. PMC 1291.21]|uniref:hypothetical protein n=1 Tax=unclassified Limnospira TaxID=2642885 RepID=UPI0028E12081|nr:MULTISPECIES: hypothetical protein [unclassified Limnospira]MDT9180113.1 hypothetical protein [Limnospira sp. PMC 1238.20]MDT9195391.1 hypothetical protein [Limnospira sp. PMC 1245.20]MDT9205620.1 hypothetical protein [Limnospira sp. PMC 1243.20]MDT9210779.1 hypothetical protein [Limnospira sp. PMC 1252.20]MDT9215861.1 hypothetical protein [Limnospira sp. PMC 1256.20]
MRSPFPNCPNRQLSDKPDNQPNPPPKLSALTLIRQTNKQTNKRSHLVGAKGDRFSQ